MKLNVDVDVDERRRNGETKVEIDGCGWLSFRMEEEVATRPRHYDTNFESSDGSAHLCEPYFREVLVRTNIQLLT